MVEKVNRGRCRLEESELTMPTAGCISVSFRFFVVIWLAFVCPFPKFFYLIDPALLYSNYFFF